MLLLWKNTKSMCQETETWVSQWVSWRLPFPCSFFFPFLGRLVTFCTVRTSSSAVPGFVSLNAFIVLEGCWCQYC